MRLPLVYIVSYESKQQGIIKVSLCNWFALFTHASRFTPGSIASHIGRIILIHAKQWRVSEFCGSKKNLSVDAIKRNTYLGHKKA